MPQGAQQVSGTGRRKAYTTTVCIGLDGGDQAAETTSEEGVGAMPDG